jgi:cytosine/adenosine deaminase-related metal-dependent hydrolase
MGVGNRANPEETVSTATVLRRVRPLGEPESDIVIRDGVIAAIGPDAGTSAADAEVIEGDGQLVFPALVDAHTHIDKTLMGMGWHRHDVGPSLLALIENERRVRREEGIDAHQQSMRHARAALATGTTRIRTHVDIDTEIGLTGFEGVMRTREVMAGAVRIQIVAFPQSGMLVRPGTVELLEEALRNGAEVMGGLDPSAIDRDPARHLDTIFDLATRHDVDLDVHLHEPGELGAFAIELIAERTAALGYQGRVTISHAFALGGVEEGRFDQLCELVVANDIAIMTHGPGGHRMIPNVKTLRARGVRVCTGNDGVRDSWSPLNTPDMLERIYIICYRNGLRRDDDIEEVIRVASEGGAQVMGVDRPGLVVGADADLMLVPGETHVEAVISRPVRSLVMARGKVVARNGEVVI